MQAGAMRRDCLLWNFLRGAALDDPRGPSPRTLGSATLFDRRSTRGGRLRGDAHGNGFAKAVQHLVGGVLQAGVGLMQLASGLRGKLAELVAVGNVGECSKNKV